jgi:pentapeptide MXKDX repeat protein
MSLGKNKNGAFLSNKPTSKGFRKMMNLKVLGLAASLVITAGLASCSGGANQATPGTSASPAASTTGDAMKGDAMKGDAMKGDAMKGDAMKGDK